MKPRTVLFIHGMFMTPSCWADWIPHFEQQGFRAMAPAWPLHEGTPAEQRQRHPDAALGHLTLDDVVGHYAKLVTKLPEAPILIGHSMGGLIVQLLLARGLAVGGVAIDSAPPQGVLSLKWSFLKSNWPVISPFANKQEPYLLTLEDFRYAFAHTLSPDELQAAYDRHVVPESRLVGNAPTTAAAKIDFQAKRPPLLIIAGAEDRIHPASLNRSMHKKYGSSSVTAYKEFPGRTHYTLGQAGWEEVSRYAIDWLRENVAQS